MARIQWEYDLVERPFCQQLQAMGWEWLEGDVDVPELTERASFAEVLLKERLATKLKEINLRDGRPWLDDARIAKAIRDLEQAAGQRLMEINQAATALLLKGTEVDGLPDWDHGRNQPVKYIDFTHPENNDFPVINPFKVELTSGRGHVIPDAVLFVYGIPLVVAEFKSPGIENPIREAIIVLAKYLLQDAELDGATVPILYEGRTADGLVKDAPTLDELFEDLFRDYEPDELDVIKAKYGTEGDILEAPLMKAGLEERIRFLASRVGASPSRIEVRDLGFRWGSCSKNRIAYFNWKMLQLPIRLADYVIAHELAHLIEPRHGREFSRLLDRSLPDWRERQKELQVPAAAIYWCGT